MSSEIIFSEYDDHLQISYREYNDVDDFLNSLDKAAKICSKKKYSFVMLDILDFDFSKVNDADRFIACKKIAEISRSSPNNIKFAVVGSEGHYDEFADNVATNRGALFKVFYNKNDAVNWIKNQ